VSAPRRAASGQPGRVTRTVKIGANGPDARITVDLVHPRASRFRARIDRSARLGQRPHGPQQVERDALTKI